MEGVDAGTATYVWSNRQRIVVVGVIAGVSGIEREVTISGHHDLRIEAAVEGKGGGKVDEDTAVVVVAHGEGGSSGADVGKGEGDGVWIASLDSGVAKGVREAARDERRSDREDQEGEGLCELFHSNSYSCQKILF